MSSFTSSSSISSSNNSNSSSCINNHPPVVDRVAHERAVLARNRWLRYLLLLSAAFFTLMDAVKQDAYNNALLDYFLPEPKLRTPKQIASILVVNDVSITAVQMVIIGLFEQLVLPSIWCTINYMVSLLLWTFFTGPRCSLVGLLFLFALRSANVRYSMVVHWFGPLYYKYTMAIQFFVSVLPYIVKLPLFHFAREVVFERQQEFTIITVAVFFLLAGALFHQLGVFVPPSKQSTSLQQTPRRPSTQIVVTATSPSHRTIDGVLVSPTVTRLQNAEPAGIRCASSPRSLVVSDSLLPFTAPTRLSVYDEEDAMRLAHDRDLMAFIRSRDERCSGCSADTEPASSTVIVDKSGSWTCNLSCCLFLAAVYYDFRMFDTYANQRLNYDFTYDMVYVHVGLYTVVFLSNVSYNLFKHIFRRWLQHRQHDQQTIVRLMNRARFVAVLISFLGVLSSRVLFLALQLSDLASFPLLLLCVCSGGLGGNIQPLLAEFMFRQRCPLNASPGIHDTGNKYHGKNDEDDDAGARAECGKKRNHSKDNNDDDENKTPVGCARSVRTIWKRHSDQLFKWIYVDGRNLVNIPLLLLWFTVAPFVGSWWFTANTIALLCLSFTLYLDYYFRHACHLNLQ